MKKVIAVTLLLAVALMVIPALASADDKGWIWNLRQQRLEVGRALIEVQSTNVAEILPYYADEIEYHDPIVDIYGKDTMTAFLFQLFGSSPDLVTTIEDETLIGGIYSVTWTMVGQFAGVPYESKGISIIKFKRWSAQVYYQRDYYSENDIMINIPGLDQAAIGFRTYYRCAVDPTYDCPLEDEAGTESEFKPTDESLHANKGFGWIYQWWLLRQQRLEVGRALVEINEANWESLLQYYSQDYEYHDPIVDIYGFDVLVPFFARLFASSPDLITTVEDETLVGGVYMATWTMSGMFNGVPYTAPGMSIVKFSDGTAQTYYSRDYYTEGDIMAGIPGLDEAVLGFRTFYRCAVDPTFDCPLVDTAKPGAFDIEVSKGNTPPADTYTLNQNYPNPFNPSTEIMFAVPGAGANVSLRIYDLKGNLVRTLVDGFEPSGTRTVTWFGKNDMGQTVGSGTYFYQLTAPSFSEMKKMVLLK